MHFFDESIEKNHSNGKVNKNKPLTWYTEAKFLKIYQIEQNVSPEENHMKQWAPACYTISSILQNSKIWKQI